MPMQAVVQLNAPPGTQVFKLQARDPDLDSNIRYYLVRDRSKYMLSNIYIMHFTKLSNTLGIYNYKSFYLYVIKLTSLKSVCLN